MIRVFCSALVVFACATLLQAQLVTMTVAPDSTISLSLGDHQVGTGKITLTDIQPLFDPDFKHDLALGAGVVKNLHFADNLLTYTESFGQLDVDYTIHLNGEDLKVIARITNNSSKPFNWFCFNGPTFKFARNATGVLSSWHSSYLQARGPRMMHPSYQVPFGGAYATDDSFGIGCSTESHLTKMSMFCAAYQSNGIIPANCTLQFMGDASIEPLASKTIDYTVRISANTDWKHLLQNYRDTYQTQTGGQHYNSDHHPWAFFASADPVWVTATDPFGFAGFSRRFDLPRGAAAFVSEYGFPAQGVMQGMILWIPQGVNPRGASYRPDFDCFPDVIQANLSIVTAGFAKFGERIGLATRPSQIIWPVSYAKDGITTLDGRNQDQLDALWKRYDNVIKQGFNAFYLDTFGVNYNDYLVAKFLRSKLGPDIPTFSEMTNDLTAAYSGAYVEITNKNGDTRWFDHHTLEILLWLNPNMEIICKDVSKAGLSAIYAHHMSPLIEDDAVKASRAQVKYLNTQYLNGTQWK